MCPLPPTLCLSLGLYPKVDGKIVVYYIYMLLDELCLTLQLYGLLFCARHSFRFTDANIHIPDTLVLHNIHSMELNTLWSGNLNHIQQETLTKLYQPLCVYSATVSPMPYLARRRQIRSSQPTTLNTCKTKARIKWKVISFLEFWSDYTTGERLYTGNGARHRLHQLIIRP